MMQRLEQLTQRRGTPLRSLLDTAQAASNAVTQNVSGPVDLIGAALRGMGVPVPEDAIGSSQWFERMGLTRPVGQGAAKVVGETLGMTAPIVAAAKAPQIAGGLIDEAERFRRYNQALGPVGAAHVVPPSAAKSSGVPVSLPSDDVFSQAVANTPNAQITPEGLLMRVQRNQVAEQGGMPSVRGGVFYLPEGAAQAKYYSTGKTGYGGSEKIAGETLVRNPLFVKGATGGKAPEAAYDQLLGKGAYQNMRNDALKPSLGYGVSKETKIQQVKNFLDKYAPELSDQATTIVANSAKGNQLPYALQEAAVGSAARKAGHDAVVGFSKQKTGAPFLSELFDLRERVYPDKFGGFGVWEQFDR